MITICDGANALIDNHGLFEPLTPAAACHVLVPSGFDASAGLLTRSRPASAVQIRLVLALGGSLHVTG